jgi:hypothetical protein
MTRLYKKGTRLRITTTSAVSYRMVRKAWQPAENTVLARKVITITEGEGM